MKTKQPHVDYMKIFENRRKNYQFIALLIYFKNISFPTQLQENYKPFQSIKLLCIKERTGNFFSLLGFNQSLHCVKIIIEVLKYRYEVPYGCKYKRNLMGK